MRISLSLCRFACSLQSNSLILTFSFPLLAWLIPQQSRGLEVDELSLISEQVQSQITIFVEETLQEKCVRFAAIASWSSIFILHGCCSLGQVQSSGVVCEAIRLESGRRRRRESPACSRRWYEPIVFAVFFSCSLSARLNAVAVV